MDRLKRARKPLRMTLTKVLDEVQQELAKDAPSRDILRLRLDKMERVARDIAELDAKILDALLDSDCTDEVYSAECGSIEGYDDSFNEMRYKVNCALCPRSESPSSINSSATQKRRTYKLPEIELPKFNGDLKEWLGFWSQFQKIHTDEEMDASDKFQYLVQAMVKGSRAREVVDSYPQTAENYEKVIHALQSRFGKEELLVEVYVRELLRLVINNVGHAREKFVLSRMYDKLESHLRALDTLGVTIEKYAAMLYPLVESSLPEPILVAWQRNQLSTRDGSTEDPPRSRLSFLMEFLRHEVEGEERISLARAGFSTPSKNKGQPGKEDSTVPTAAGLFSGTSESKQEACLFCDKTHLSRDCYKAQTMTLAEKRAVLKGKKACYICFRTNHVAKKCKASVRCQVCHKKHYTLMCPDLPSHRDQEQEGPTEKSPERAETNQTPLNVMMSYACTREVILQTVILKISGQKGERRLRALIDTGSQRSYILKKTALEMGCEPVAQDTIIHALFGGTTTGQQQHSKYLVRLGHIRQPYAITIAVFDQDVICGTLPRVSYGPWLDNLKKNGIWLNDVGPGNPDIEVLLGADVLGQLLTGRIFKLGAGLTAVETRFGWTLMGISPEDKASQSHCMTVGS